MRRVALIACLAVTACATGPDEVAVNNGLVGQDETTLVRTLGVPTRTIDTDGHRFLAYRREAPSQIYGGGFVGYGGGFFGPGFGPPLFGGFGGFPGEIVRYACETTFDVVDRRVTTWSRRGNAC